MLLAVAADAPPATRTVTKAHSGCRAYDPTELASSTIPSAEWTFDFSLESLDIIAKAIAQHFKGNDFLSQLTV